MEEALKAMESAPRRFLDALVDSTFKFTGNALDPSEVLYCLHYIILGNSLLDLRDRLGFTAS
jgi:hypothetical protein